ncbi:hypothetical protein BGW39_001930 [Mortierella sp. 14UC]|nr:hypothetical protein BGW39_001930 [Mortierella sp. 14UC]
MSNPAVAKWLEEIAAAKAKAQAKEQQQQQEQEQQQQQSAESSKGLQERSPQQPTPSTSKTTSRATTTQYGIIPSYNLRTRKKQLRLVLPPEPRKPGPGECCGNDCEPCVNTIYWEDLEAHRNKCRKLQQQFEEECRALESEGSVSREEAGSIVGSDGRKGLQVDEEEGVGVEGDDGVGLSIRSYRPFKVLLREHLSENTLLVVCDLPYSSQKETNQDSRPSRTRTNKETLFHLLIRFQQQADGQFLTRAFTPLNLSRLTQEIKVKVTREGGGSGRRDIDGLKYRTVDEVGRGFEDRMAFLVKLYPSPHATSDMFRALEVYAEDDDGGSQSGDSDEENRRMKKGVLFLRGPIQTGRDRQRNQQYMELESSSSNTLRMDSTTKGTPRRYKRKRIVMIAAGSGITPMYQVLHALHDQQHQQQQHISSREGGAEEKDGGRLSYWEADEVDLVYCNRTTDDIWLRQELQFFGSVSDKEKEQLDEETAALTISEMASLSLVKRTVVRVQHVLSSPSSSTYQSPIDQDGQRHNSTQHQFHTGRITLDLLRNTLHLPPTALQQQDNNGNDNGEQLQILVCGPPLFNKDVSTMLTLMGYTDSASCEIHILE